MSKNSIPDRWRDYTGIGNVLDDTRLVPMKVPLKDQLLCKIPEDEWLSCQDVLQHFQNQDLHLGLIVDLTFTNRYYDPVVFKKQGIQHCKILMPGHVLPSKKIVEKFKDAVNVFFSENQDNNSVVAIHCTHGVNRTGYLICRYLIEEKNFKPDEAIELFEKSRRHKIERPVYVNHLKSLKSSLHVNLCTKTKNVLHVQDDGGNSRVTQQHKFFPARSYAKPHQHDFHQHYQPRFYNQEHFFDERFCRSQQNGFYHPQTHAPTHDYYQNPQMYGVYQHRPVDYHSPRASYPQTFRGKNPYNYVNRPRSGYRQWGREREPYGNQGGYHYHS